MARPDYRTRLQSDAELPEPEPPRLRNKAIFQAVNRPSQGRVTLFPSGIELSDAECHCLLAYIQDVEDWVLGAFIGAYQPGQEKDDCSVSADNHGRPQRDHDACHRGRADNHDTGAT